MLFRSIDATENLIVLNHVHADTVSDTPESQRCFIGSTQSKSSCILGLDELMQNECDCPAAIKEEIVCTCVHRQNFPNSSSSHMPADTSLQFFQIALTFQFLSSQMSSLVQTNMPLTTHLCSRPYSKLLIMLI